MDLLPIPWVFIFCLHLQGSAGVSFTSPFGGSNLTAGVGSSLNFSWTFQGDFKLITFTFLASPDQINIQGKDKLLVIEKSGKVSVNQSYAGRLMGSWNNQRNPGEVMFSLSSIQAQDGRLYGCHIQPPELWESPVVDPVNLVVIELQAKMCLVTKCSSFPIGLFCYSQVHSFSSRCSWTM